MNNLTRSVPKPVKDTSPDPHEVVFKARAGSEGALMAVINHLREVGKVSQGVHTKRANGEVDPTLTVHIYELAKHYEPAPERPYVDRSADIYVLQSQLNPKKIKVGLSIHVPVRTKQVSRKFEEPFERIHAFHALDAKARETYVHNYLREHGAVDLGYEQFLVEEWHLDWLRSLPNE